MQVVSRNLRKLSPSTPFLFLLRHGHHGRLLFRPLYVLLFEVIDEPTCRRARRTVGSIDGGHYHHTARGRYILGCDLNERAAGEVRLDHVNWQAAIPESSAPEGKLGSKMGQAPDSCGPYGGSQGLVEIRGIDVYELNVLGEDDRRNRPTAGRERVLRRNDHAHPDRQ